MKKRSIAAVLLLPFVTLGIYGLYWLVSTKIEMNKLGASIPTSWLLIVPFVNIWWLWKYSEGAEHVTNGKTSGILAFILLWFIPWPGEAIIQSNYNSLGAPEAATPPAEPTPPAPEAPAAPAA